MSNNERSLADASSETPNVEDAPVTVTDASDYDFGDFVAGLRPTRRRVKIFPHAHLIEQIEAVADRIEATPEGENVDELIDAHRLWSDWLARGRVRKFALVAEKTGSSYRYR